MSLVVILPPACKSTNPLLPQIVQKVLILAVVILPLASIITGPPYLSPKASKPTTISPLTATLPGDEGPPPELNAVPEKSTGT